MLLVLCFGSVHGFAFSNPWKGSDSKCKKYDFYCKRTSSKLDTKETKEMSSTQELKKISAAESANNTELNIYTGLFDFSDNNQKAGLFGLQHQDEELFRKSFLGKLSPVTGVFLTENNAFYLYTGVQAEYEFGFLNVTPSFTPGYYNYGNGKDLGYPLEFKSEIQISLDLNDNTNLGMSYNHISNASLGTKNPGANSYMFNFLKKF